MKKATSILLAVLVFCCVNSALGVTWNVPGDSATIQGGIDMASYGDTVQVAAGTYVENITLKNGVALIGAGAATTIIDGNNIGSVVTSSSCDPNTVIDGFTITRGNAYEGGGMHNYDSRPTITGCTFSGNSSTLWSFGGAMSNSYSSPVITGCKFINNVAESEILQVGTGLGGAMWNYNCSPVITGCTFINNVARGAGTWQKDTGQGGAMYNDSSSPVISGCLFEGNQGLQGAGMYNYQSNPVITGSRFIRNLTTYHHCGSGMHNHASGPMVTNCTFNGNGSATPSSAYPYAGGIYGDSNSNLTVINSAFIGNVGNYVGGIRGNNTTVVNCTFSANIGRLWAGACDIGPSPSVVTNSVFWGDTSAYGRQEIGEGGVPVTYSDVQGGYSGTGNVNADPLFVRDPNWGADGVWETEDDDYGDLRLSEGSSCVDKGSNAGVPPGITADIDGYPRIIDGDCNGTEVVDMGAYEFNYTYMGDVDYSCGVDLYDFSVFARAWLTQEGDAGWNRACDISNPLDDYIDLNDLQILCNNWLAVIP